MTEKARSIFDAIDRHARSVLAGVGLIGCVAIYADFRCVIQQQFTGYSKIAENISTLTEEVKSTAAAVRENSIRLEHLEREHEAARSAPRSSGL